MAADQEVLKLCDEVWKFRLAESPELATFCGFHQYDDSWDDIGEEAYIRKEKCAQSFLSQAEQFKEYECSPSVALSLRLLKEDLQLSLQGSQYKSQYMPINYLEGIHIDCNLTISYMKFNTTKDFDKYISRLQKLPQRVKDVITMLKKGVQLGIVMYRCSVDPIPKNLGKMLSEDVDKLGLMEPFSKEHPDIPVQSLSEYKEKAKTVITIEIFPAFAQLKTYLENEYINSTRPKEGICSLPSGLAWYQQCLNFHLSCYMTPQEVHNVGLKEVARIKENILTVAARENLGTTLPEILQNIVKKQAGYFKSKEEILAYVRHLCNEEIRPKIKQLFKNIPDLPLSVQPTPDYMADGPQGYYLNGTPDGSRDGQYFINTSKVEECYPFPLTALSLHEGEPGHHLQMVYSLAATDLPDFRRYCEDSKYYLAPNKLSFFTAYVEGWGLYSESLGEELGMYSDSLKLLGRYSFEIFRATRLVVDTGLHAFGWTREQAAQYMIDNNLTVESEVRSEVDRYITWPGQACAYKIGELKIWELRRKAFKALGPLFDIKEFHSCVMTCGPVPLTVLEHLVDKLIEDTLKQG